MIHSLLQNVMRNIPWRSQLRPWPRICTIHKRIMTARHVHTTTSARKSGRDYYSVLGVSRSASQSEIRSAYLKLVKQKHPDRNPNKAVAHREFTELQEAYSVLGDENKRKLYDNHAGSGQNHDSWTQQTQQHGWQQQQQQTQQGWPQQDWQRKQQQQEFEQFWREFERIRREQEKEFERLKQRSRRTVQPMHPFVQLFLLLLVIDFFFKLISVMFGGRRSGNERRD